MHKKGRVREMALPFDFWIKNFLRRLYACRRYVIKANPFLLRRALRTPLQGDRDRWLVGCVEKGKGKKNILIGPADSHHGQAIIELADTVKITFL